MNNRFRTYKGKDVTGIGAAACARHGCYCPGAVVDFHKGERYSMSRMIQQQWEKADTFTRQSNMDYALSEAMKNTNIGEISRLLLLYDINCQYSIYLQEQFRNSHFLEMPTNLTLIHGIGLMHIGGHIPACFPRYTPTFIDGAGRVDGEVLESLWSVLNEVSPSTQNATHASRREMLDDHMNDSNWKKMLGTGKWGLSQQRLMLSIFPRGSAAAVVLLISRRYTAAVKGHKAALSDLITLKSSSTDEEIVCWDTMAAKAQADRLDDPAAMDIYDSEAVLRARLR